jgi:DNA repair exonuclease SbcCD ATPase subunit
MKLRSLAVNQFKKFTSPTRLDGIGDGLNIVLGPNEMGKSTLLDALRAVLFEKYSSKAQPILGLQNDRNNAAPVVELTFELAAGRFIITKRFLKKEYALLSCPDGRRLEGDAAEDELRRLINFDEPGRNGAKPETLGMWNVLWVQQGQSFGAIDFPESARESIHGALESEVGAVLGGRRGVALPQIIEKQLGELVTGKARTPRGNYKKLVDDIAFRRLDLAALRMKRQALSEDFGKLAKASEDLERLSASARDDTLRAELSDARKRQKELVEFEAKIKAANSDLEHRKRDLEEAIEAQEERRRLKETMVAEAAAAEVARKRREEVEFDLQELESRREQIRACIRDAEAAVKKASESVSWNQRVLGAVKRGAAIRELQAQRDRADVAGRRLSEAQQKTASILVTGEVLKRIHFAAKELESVTARLTAAATLIAFDIPAECLPGIAINGEQLTGEQRLFRAIEATTIAIPGRGHITIEPAIQDREKLLRQRREAERTLHQELTRAGAADVNDAEEQNFKREKLLQVAALARQEVELNAPATDDREAGVQPLTDFIAGLQQILAREMCELDLRELPSALSAENAVREADERAGAARSALEAQRDALAGPEERLDRLRTELGSVRQRHANNVERLEKLRRQLETVQAECPDHVLQERIDRTRAAFLTQQAVTGALQRQGAGDTLPQIEARIERLEQAIKEKWEWRGNLEREISGLSARIEALEADGIDEKIGRSLRELELAEKQRGRLDREVQVLALLLSTLRAAEQNAKERYLAPVVKRVEPYLGYLFPGAGITIGDNFHVTAVTRQCGYAEDFRHLSMGTQEQIAVLVRLAFAEMLAGQGRPAAVILDDALVFSDDPRMGRMIDILKIAAQKVQVIVLSCREQLFEELGGRRLTLQSGIEDELRSA